MFVKVILFCIAVVVLQQAVAEECDRSCARATMEDMTRMMRDAMDQGQEGRMMESMRSAFRSTDSTQDMMRSLRSSMRRRVGGENSGEA